MRWMIWSRKRSKREKRLVPVATAHLLASATGTLCGRRITGITEQAAEATSHCRRCETLFLKEHGT